MQNSIFVKSIEEIDLANSLLTQAEQLFKDKINIRFLALRNSIPPFLSLGRNRSLKKIKESIRTAALTQQGYYTAYFRQNDTKKTYWNNTVFGKDKNDEIIFQKDINEAPGIILEMLSESKKCASLADWQEMVYWDLGKFEDSIRNCQGIWLDKTIVLLFWEEVSRLEDGEIVNTKDWNREIKSYAVENGRLHRIWGNSAV